MKKHVDFTLQDGIAVITMDSPPVNAFTDALHDDFRTTLADAGAFVEPAQGLMNAIAATPYPTIALERAGKTAVIGGVTGEAITYGELHERVARMAGSRAAASALAIASPAWR